jgi:hypothetical protein
MRRVHGPVAAVLAACSVVLALVALFHGATDSTSIRTGDPARFEANASRMLSAADPVATRAIDPATHRAREAEAGGAGGRGSIVHEYGRVPLYFEANLGQVHPDVGFLARRDGALLFLTSTGFVLETAPRGAPAGVVVSMSLVGAKPEPAMEGLEVLPGRSNYLLGSDREAWRTGIPHYSRIIYRQVYDGVDLVFHGDRGALEYDFILASRIDPAQIRLSFGGVEEIGIDSVGRLVLATAAGEILHQPPHIYQAPGAAVEELSGASHPGSDTDKPGRAIVSVPGRYVVREGGEVGFEVLGYDPELPLVIDPVLSYSTYAGGGSLDQAHAVAVDAQGQAYISGSTASADFPTASGPFQGADQGLTDTFVMKLDATGSNLVYSTYLGGTGDEIGRSLAIDSAGNVFLVGQTDSTDFPTVNAVQGAPAGGSGADAFVSKLNPAGSALVYSTYLGGTDHDVAQGVAVDAVGSAYVVGQTDSSDFPTVNPILTDAVGTDAFVFKLNPNGGGPVYATYFGGSGGDEAHDVALDSAGNVYAAGMTSSNNIPFVSKIQPLPGGNQDVFLLKVNAAGSAFPLFSYLGGTGDEVGEGIAVDLQGNIYLAAQTSSSDFPTTPGAYQTDYHGGRDTAVAKVNPAGDTLIYSTYIGGTSNDDVWALAIDAHGSAYVTGETSSTDYPTVRPAQADNAGGDEIYLTKFNASGSGLQYSTYFGGGGSDIPYAVAVDAEGSAYVAGRTSSTAFPTLRPMQGTSGGAIDVFVLKVEEVLDFWIAQVSKWPDSRGRAAESSHKRSAARARR